MSFQGEGVGNERRGVELSLGQECEDFRNIAAIHPACLEGEVFPVHLRERKDLGRVIHRHNGDQGRGPGALPGQGKVSSPPAASMTTSAPPCSVWDRVREALPPGK